jgi:membrane-bound lytic murein transglycosylase D
MFQKLRLIYTLLVIQFLLVSSTTPAMVQPETLPRPPLTEAEILLDMNDRISSDFKVAPALIPRVSFWFDIYTKYGFQHRIIHHQDFPWFIVEVVDVSDLLTAPSNALWLNYEKADRKAHTQLNEARKKFKTLALKVRKNKPLDESETALLQKVELLPGDLHHNLARLSDRLRIQTGQKDFYVEGLKKSTRYLEFMEKIFESQGLPPELTRLPLVESSFNEDAGSKVGALGIWQLMPQVSQKFIKVSAEIDERKSPYKATYVAARLFRENFKILKGVWPLVVTAYNHGPGGVRKAAKTVGSEEMATIIEKYQTASFSFASENFYCEFLAALIAQSYSDEIFGDLVSREFTHVDAIILPRRVRVRELIALSELPESDFLSFNPDLKHATRSNQVLPKGLSVYLPSSQVSSVVQGLEKHIRVAQK